MARFNKTLIIGALVLLGLWYVPKLTLGVLVSYALVRACISIFFSGPENDSELYVFQLAWIEPDRFTNIVMHQEELLIFHSETKWPPKYHQYITEYKGQKLGTRSKQPLTLPHHSEVIDVQFIQGPGSLQGTAWV